HNIDIVIDRLKINPDITSRLTGSAEAAMKITDGLSDSLNLLF
ncbi:MAG: hypothetical protein K6E97_09290, partial [Treponema sp.]|nr:hypothetical protein [Treponema sp.]